MIGNSFSTLRAGLFVVSVVLLFLFHNKLSGQKEEYVIAPNGLKVRDAPSLAGKVIALLPFGERVQVVKKDINHIDTLYSIKNNGNYYSCINGVEYFGRGDMFIIGSWVKISTGNKTGYVVDNYLFERQPATKDLETIYFDKNNTSWELQFNPKQYNWYALRKEQEGVKLVRSYPDFISQCSEYSGQVITPIYDKMDASIGLIGTKKSLLERVIEDPMIDANLTREANTGRFIKVSGPELTSDTQLVDSCWVYEFIAAPAEELILLEFSAGATTPIKVKFIGDIDSDGERDYIIWSNTIYDLFEMSLYLSLDRKDGIYIKSAHSRLDFD